MKDQYVGDINDYRKYAILRAFAGDGDLKIGVCWMRTPPDGRTDGRMIEYLGKPEIWRAFDPTLFDLMRGVAGTPDQRRLTVIEESAAIPGAVYHDAMVPSGVAPRAAYFAKAMQALADCGLVFFDPDNGLEVPSVGKARKDAPKFVYLDEIAAAYEAGHSVLFYQHFPRVPREVFIEQIAARLHRAVPGAIQWIFRTAHVAFVLLVRPEQARTIESRIISAGAAWPEKFVAISRTGDTPFGSEAALPPAPDLQIAVRIPLIGPNEAGSKATIHA